MTLNKYPRLKRAVFRHECEHLFDKNLFDFLRTDIRDYPKLFGTKDFIHYFQYIT